MNLKIPMWTSPLAMACDLDPTMKRTPALDLINARLVEANRTPRAKLLLSMSPQEGKTLTIARWFPIWLLWLNRRRRITYASYDLGLARTIQGLTRDTVRLYSEQLGMTLNRAYTAKQEWQLIEGGGVYAAGIGGGLSGRASECVGPDTLIDCEYGRITASEAHRRGIGRILAYDHFSKRPVWRRVEASKRTPSRRVVEIVTQAGRVLTCTPDHLVYTRRGYCPAGNLRPGDALVAFPVATGVSLRSLVCAESSRDPQGCGAGPKSLLLSDVRPSGHIGNTSNKVLPYMRQVGTEKRGDLLLERVSRYRAQEEASRDSLPYLRNMFPSSLTSDSVLLSDMREYGALPENGWIGQLAPQGRDELRQVVSHDETACHGAGSRSVRSLRAGSGVHLEVARGVAFKVGSDHSSHRSAAVEQCARESDHAVLSLSHYAPQVSSDTVSMVRESSGGTVDVYDFQVEGTRNFFADGVLVHNCMIIDDPFKGATEAESPRMRENAWTWWQSVASARLAPGAPVIVLSTRYHEDDLIGRLSQVTEGERWELLNIPAQAEHDPSKGETDILGREPGEFMVSARGRTREEWQQRKINAGTRQWQAMYQGRPSPAEGSILKREWWERSWYDGQLWVPQSDGSRVVPGAEEVIITVDCAFKAREDSDFVAMGVWMRRGVDVYLLDLINERLDFNETCNALLRLSARWPQAILKVVEEAANGPAVMAALRGQLGGIVGEIPQGSKESRAYATTPYLEAGNVHLPRPEQAPWVGDFLEQAAMFPNGSHDDMVDTYTMAVNRLLIQPLEGEVPDSRTEEEMWSDLQGWSVSPL